MKIYHIGTIAFETENTKRELKSIGGITGYIIELIHYTISKDIKIGFIGKIFNYYPKDNFEYFEVQKNVTSTNKFLLHLFLKSFFIQIAKSSIIHAHRPDHLTALLLLKKRKSVITLHGQQAHTINIRKGKLIRMVYHWMERYAVAKTNALIAVDDVTKDFYSALYPKYDYKIVTIPTGVNTKIFKPLNRKNLRNKLGFDEQDKIIVYVGRIEPPKKLDDIVKAFKLIYIKDNSFRLVIVGDGVLFQEMVNLTKKIEMEHVVHFLGVRKRNELPEVFNIADISVLYSGNEGSPLSVKESLACGIPVVANNVGDIPVVIQNGYNGYIVKQESIESLAQTMMLAIEKAKDMKSNCLKSILPYSTDKVNKQVIDLYKTILDE